MMPSDNEGLRHLVDRLQQQVSLLEEELRLLRHKIFGRRSERVSPGEENQSSLFDEAELSLAAQKTPEPEESIEVAAHKRAKPGRKPLPADLPREEVVHDIPEEEKTCSPLRKPADPVSALALPYPAW